MVTWSSRSPCLTPRITLPPVPCRSAVRPSPDAVPRARGALAVHVWIQPLALDGDLERASCRETDSQRPGTDSQLTVSAFCEKGHMRTQAQDTKGMAQSQRTSCETLTFTKLYPQNTVVQVLATSSAERILSRRVAGSIVGSLRIRSHAVDMSHHILKLVFIWRTCIYLGGTEGHTSAAVSEPKLEEAKQCMTGARTNTPSLKFQHPLFGLSLTKSNSSLGTSDHKTTSTILFSLTRLGLL